MTSFSRRVFMATATTSALALFAGTGVANATNDKKRAKIDAQADAALEKLVAGNSQAKAFAEKATALLIFPRIGEAGIAGVGAKRGRGVLRQADKSLAYYRTTSVSFGLELGFETHGYVIMFMSHEAAQNFATYEELNLGAQAEITIIRGAAAEVTTTSLKSDVVAFIFDEKGAIMNLTLEGTVINRMNI